MRTDKKRFLYLHCASKRESLVQKCNVTQERHTLFVHNLTIYDCLFPVIPISTLLRSSNAFLYLKLVKKLIKGFFVHEIMHTLSIKCLFILFRRLGSVVCLLMICNRKQKIGSDINLYSGNYT